MSGKPWWYRLRVPLAVLAITASGFEAARFAGYRLNLSPSEPVGVWRVRAGAAAVGDYAYFCPPVALKRYPFLFKGGCPGGSMPFLKKLAAGPGALIRETAAGVWIDGKRLPASRPRIVSLGSDPVLLPHWRGAVRLQAGQFWAYGSGDPAQSFDSRYWGPLSATRIEGVAWPVWTVSWPGETAASRNNDDNTKESR
ncbi:MAG: S26 family signal peptidase [Acidihalobacter sp.]|uniref:S26 family signal peptidase n=1 Tax=Acidihalobacter sp. TaxID=1872108 RepID=UPI00307D82D1